MAKKLFDDYDTNGNGYIERKELKNLFKTLFVKINPN